jgi:inosose dehydratase
MNRRQLLSAAAASLGVLRGRANALFAPSRPNIQWCVSSFLWTSTQWSDTGTLPYTEMLDVIRDTGFNGYRFTGWPGILSRIGMDLSQLEKELSKRNLRIATLSFSGPADDPAGQPQMEKSAREACQFLKRFGATEMVTFSPRRPNKVLVREHLRRACEFYNHLGDVCAEYGIRTGMHNHSQGQLVETQDEIEMLLRWTDPKKFHWCPDTVHLYMANCDIPALFRKHAHRLIFFDLVDAKYEYQKEEMRLPNGKVEKAGSQNGTFMLGNRDYGDGEVPLQEIMRIIKTVKYKGWINIDHHYSRVSPRDSLTRCMKYIGEKLDRIYS